MMTLLSSVNGGLSSPVDPSWTEGSSVLFS